VLIVSDPHQRLRSKGTDGDGAARALSPLTASGGPAEPVVLMGHELVWIGLAGAADGRLPGRGSIIRDHPHPKRLLRPGRETVRLETEPGRQLQTGWAVRKMIAGQKTTAMSRGARSVTRGSSILGDRLRRRRA
jgi:hypothetical protein